MTLPPLQELRNGRDLKEKCLLVPTFRNTPILLENFSGRHVELADIDVYILDDNSDPREASHIKKLCEANSWSYLETDRGRHTGFQRNRKNFVSYNRSIWEALVALGELYTVVVKMDPTCYIIRSGWHDEFSNAQGDDPIIFGTPEYRPTHDVKCFWDGARDAGFSFELSSHVMHMQGGLYALNWHACLRLGKMGFVSGDHTNLRDDCYIAYSCQLIGVKFIQSRLTGSWIGSRRPPLDSLTALRAIHPLRRSEWERFDDLRVRCDPDLTRPIVTTFLSSKPKIPRVAHFVWLGGPLPPMATKNIEAFRHHNPGWEVRVCLGLPEGLPSDLRNALLSAPKLAMRSDIIRLWLVYEFGGIYLDTDVHTVRSFEDLRYYSHFVPWERDGRVNNGVIGGEPKATALAELLQRVRILSGTKPQYILSYGPDLFTSFINESGCLNALPTHYFCSFAGHEDAHQWWGKPYDERCHILKCIGDQASDKVSPYAVHLWGIPKKEMLFGLPQSSVVDCLETGDFLLRRSPSGTCRGVYVVYRDVSLAVYLLGFHANLELFLIRERTAPGQLDDDPTSFGGDRLHWIDARGVKDLPDEYVDWIFFDGSIPESSYIEILREWFPKIKAGGFAAGDGNFQVVRRDIERLKMVDVKVEKDSTGLWFSSRDHRIQPLSSVR
jgi:hypothetical protein